MNASQRLQAAIDKLELLRTERGYVEDSGWLVEENPNDRGGFLEPPEPFIPITNDDLIVTLHRTIDAQLAILRDTVKLGELIGLGEEGTRWRSVEDAIALADAILGES